jgi:hypothetical protein
MLRPTTLSGASLDNFVFFTPLYFNVSMVVDSILVRPTRIHSIDGFLGFRRLLTSLLSIPSMPTCNCESYACSGKDVTLRAFENHQGEDKRRNFCQGYAKATQVYDKQKDDIAAYVSSLTLSDSSTGGISAPGGRLWFRSVQDDDVNDIAAYISSQLSDTATGGISAPEGRLSSRSVQDDASGSDAAPAGLRSTDTFKSHRPQASPRYAPIKRDALRARQYRETRIPASSCRTSAEKTCHSVVAGRATPVEARNISCSPAPRSPVLCHQ